MKSVFPFLDWLPKYRIKKDLPGDLIGGLTVGIVHIPQGTNNYVFLLSDLIKLARLRNLFYNCFHVQLKSFTYSSEKSNNHLAINI